MKRLNSWFRLGMLCLIPICNSCYEGDGDVPAPANVVAVAGNGQAKISWSYRPQGQGFLVTYPIMGGVGENCGEFAEGDSTDHGCKLGCHLTTSSTGRDSCTVTGLTNGLSHVF